tara:strand:+ start:314 stop:565 length:252 start_codon:yes stop_codon:yes gene_type:complete
MNNEQSTCGGCGNNFCGTCQGYGWKTCPNRQLLHILYDEGLVTEQSNMVRHFPQRQWPWDKGYYGKPPVIEGYKRCGCKNCKR